MSNKPWLRKEQLRTLTVMGAKIKVRNLTFGESRKAISSATSTNMETQQMNMDSTLIGVLRTLNAIVDWDLTDENDEKLPITLNTFDNVLDEDFVGEIIKQVANADNSHVTNKEKK
ncbi:hypothetical protein CN367_11695 [Priestia megaterium]|uniref:hypothetical protein n=1 Tax=Priestia megaterium TaxID=1404 RepID=UPI000BF3899F|nr:hypothetical protein [Priestia megaterium]PEZ47024.1 hypothetical protein CN367_11695 [Priestia megaterium]